MINANITAHSGIYIGNFTIAISFEQPVTDFTESDLTIVGTIGNGTAGVQWDLTGTGKDYMLSVMLPEGKQGRFSVSISGQVQVMGESQAQDVVADSITVAYDTIREVNATFGELEYRDNGDIALPITFYDQDTQTDKEPVLWFDKTDLMLTKFIGDDIYCHDYNLISKGDDPDAVEGADYEVVFTPSENTAGAFKVEMTGEVVKAEGLIREITPVTPKLIVYNNITPVLIDMDTPEEIAPRIWNTSLAFNVPIIGLGIQKFIYGVQTETPALYRAGSLDVEPDPLPLVERNNIHLNACIGDWIYETDNHNSQVQAKFWTLRFKTPVAETGTPELFLKENAVAPAR